MHSHIVYHGDITPQGMRNLENLSSAASRDGVNEITLYISSAGGNVNAGLGAYNFLRMLPIKVNTHCFGIVGSIAATLFLSGEQRTTDEATMFSLHAASYVEGPLKGQISPNTEAISLPFATRLNWANDRIEHYFGSTEEKLISPSEAVSLGVVHKIESLKFPMRADLIHVNVG